jgi:hypothetical protein
LVTLFFACAFHFGYHHITCTILKPSHA